MTNPLISLYYEPLTITPQRLRPRKSLGQNFLRDDNIARKIVAAVAPQPDDVLLEIGPGEGALTRHLAGRVRRLIVVEIDLRAVGVLHSTLDTALVEIIHGDILETDLPGLAAAAGRPLRVVGNIPYNITSPILFHVLDNRAAVSDLTMMMQREVAQRLVAQPRTGDYGILAVVTRMYADVRLLFDVAPGCFFPKPAVTSAVVQLSFLKDPRVPLRSDAAFRSLVRALFGKRRKTLRNGLRHFLGRDADIAATGINPGRRPEELSVEELAALSNHLVLTGHDAPSSAI